MQARNLIENENGFSDGGHNGAASSPRASTVRLLFCLWILATCAQGLSADEPVTGRLLSKWPGFFPGECQDVALEGDRLHAAVGEGGLAVLDVSNPANIRALGGYSTGGDARSRGPPATGLFPRL
ncbi:MAG: hypothetical protein HY674_03625 [Chloroflexi bacterium]|nr:hypothetical protein [Chloroflexota bacterium]